MWGNKNIDGSTLHVNVARMKKYGINFEVPINPDEAVKFRQGKDVNINDCIITQDIFTDVKKGLLAPSGKFEEAFGTKDVVEIAKILIKEGELQTSEEFRTKRREEKRTLVIALIARTAIDPTTNLPHPPVRIERAMELAKVKIDDNHSAEEQVQDIVQKMKPIMPIKLEVQHIEIVVPAKYAPKAYPIVKRYNIEKEEWQSDGALYCIVEVPAGLAQEMFDKLNHLTHGAISSKIIKTE